MEENVSNEVVTVRSVGLKFGLIMAVYSVVFFLIVSLAGLNPFDNKLGLISIPISIVILVLAHRNFKASGDGFMSYGQGIGIAVLMTLVSLIIAGLFSYFYAEIIAPEVMERFYDAQLADMESKNMSESQIEMAVNVTKRFFWLFYAIGGMLGGTIMALIVTIFTQKKNPDPTHIS
jgi:hypothetical protein